MSAKKRGPKPSGKVLRSVEISCSLTADDARKLAQFADGLGFKSRSEMVTAILERLILGGWAPVAWLKLGWQIKSRADEVRLSQDAGWFNIFESWDPLPVEDRVPLSTALLDEQPSAQQTKALLAEVRKELQK